MNTQVQALKLLAKRKQTSHVLHFIISVILWFVFMPAAGVCYAVVWWPIVALSNHLENVKIDRQLEKLY